MNLEAVKARYTRAVTGQLTIMRLCDSVYDVPKLLEEIELLRTQLKDTVFQMEGVLDFHEDDPPWDPPAQEKLRELTIAGRKLLRKEQAKAELEVEG